MFGCGWSWGFSFRILALYLALFLKVRQHPFRVEEFISHHLAQHSRAANGCVVRDAVHYYQKAFSLLLYLCQIHHKSKIYIDFLKITLIRTK